MTAQNSGKADRPFDIVVYGATGYTGRLVAEYLAHHYQGQGPKWAMAGRSADKLAEVRDLIGAPADTPLIVANSDDPASMKALAEQTRVVITTVGPYQLYGEPLLAACVAAGTDYADLCGEPVWMRQMADKYHAAAQASGARIAFSSGFDSIPFDLGVLMLQQAAKARFGAPAPRVKGRVRAMQGKFSGGTAASLTATMATLKAHPALLQYMMSPFGLTPGFAGPDQPLGDAPLFDDALGSWCAPFIMATINTKNVHRTNFLLGHPYGADFVYDEMVLTGPGDQGEAIAKHMASTPMIAVDAIQVFLRPRMFSVVYGEPELELCKSRLHRLDERVSRVGRSAQIAEVGALCLDRVVDEIRERRRAATGSTGLKQVDRGDLAINLSDRDLHGAVSILDSIAGLGHAGAGRTGVARG